jgi:hypothetical protein
MPKAIVRAPAHGCARGRPLERPHDRRAAARLHRHQSRQPLPDPAERPQFGQRLVDADQPDAAAGG